MTDQPRMLLSKVFVPQTRTYELVLTWLTTLYLVVSVDERSVFEHQRHLIALMHNLKVAILIYGRDPNLSALMWY